MIVLTSRRGAAVERADAAREVILSAEAPDRHEILQCRGWRPEHLARIGVPVLHK